MKRNFGFLYFIGLVLFLTPQALAQDMHFSNNAESINWTNPSRSGSGDGLRAATMHRTQWSTIGTNFSNTLVGLAIPLSKEKNLNNSAWNLGVVVQRESGGEQTLTDLNLRQSIAYRVTLSSKSSLALGLSGGLLQRNYGDLQGKWGSQFDGYGYDPGIASGEQFSNVKESAFDLGSGLSFFYNATDKKLWSSEEKSLRLDLSIHHLNRPDLSVAVVGTDPLPIRYQLFAEVNIPIYQSGYTIRPQFNFSRQEQFNDIVGGVVLSKVLKEGSRQLSNIQRSELGVGLLVRLHDAIILNTQMEWGAYKVGLAYDFNISTLKSITNYRGALELFLSCNLNRI